jgi:hypothetical protein
MTNKLYRTFVALLFTLVVPVALTAQRREVEQAAATITPDDYAWRVGVIAHDSMQGRDTPSPGLDKTAEWIASEFRRLGLRGGAEDGGFIQQYPLRMAVVDAGRSMLRGGGVRLAFGEDLLPARRTSDAEATGGLAIVSGALDIEAAIGGGALLGKHAVMVLSEDSPGLSRAEFAAFRSAGVLSIMTVNYARAEEWDASVVRAMRPSVRKGWGEQPDGGTSAPSLQIREVSLARLVAAHGVDLASLRARADADARVDAIAGLEITLTINSRDEAITAPNVVGILDGSDPELKDEYVVFSGHMDHVGVGSPDANGDSIFNGADDDASGTIAVVEIAEAMVALPSPPKRSMVFLLVSGEEKGLWGSEWFSGNPTVPIEQLVANLNTDMVGRNWTDTIVAIGKEHSDLGETLNRVNGDHPELRMTAIDDIWPEERFYFRSDHYNFARKGVPILFFFNGTHDDYHGRDDEPDRIDAEKAARIARLVFYLGVDIGNALERPKWNPESYARIVSDR